MVKMPEVTGVDITDCNFKGNWLFVKIRRGLMKRVKVLITGGYRQMACNPLIVLIKKEVL